MRCYWNPEAVLEWQYTDFGVHKNVFSCLFSVHNTSLSLHGSVCLMRLHFWRYFSHHGPNDGISRNVASSNILAHDVISLLYYLSVYLGHFPNSKKLDPISRLISRPQMTLPLWDHVNLSKSCNSYRNDSVQLVLGPETVTKTRLSSDLFEWFWVCDYRKIAWP